MSGAFLPFWVTLSLTAVIVGGCGEQHADVTTPSLENTFDSPEAVSRAVLSALEASDYEALRSYALNEEEFRRVVWPELPASRPGRNVPLSYAWGDLDQKSTNRLRGLVASRGGQPYELSQVGFEGETTRYETFKVHRDSILVIQSERGGVATLKLFGSMIERDGRYKLFSYNVD
ncbi:MAG: hypothetical protein ACRD1X_18085 [Vicinamibacteria bacterium]